MDGRFRRHFKGTPKHVKIGYGSNKKTRFLMPDGFLKFRVSNVAELELLLMHNKKYAAGEDKKLSFPYLLCSFSLCACRDRTERFYQEEEGYRRAC